MKPVGTVQVFALLGGLLLILLALVRLPIKPTPVNAVTVSVCGFTYAILVSDSAGGIRAFYPPFGPMPKVSRQWDVPLPMRNCEPATLERRSPLDF